MSHVFDELQSETGRNAAAVGTDLSTLRRASEPVTASSVHHPLTVKNALLKRFKHQLQVARDLSRLHAKCLGERNTAAKPTVMKNNTEIMEHRFCDFNAKLHNSARVLCTRYAQFFRRPGVIEEAVRHVMKILFYKEQ